MAGIIKVFRPRPKTYTLRRFSCIHFQTDVYLARDLLLKGAKLFAPLVDRSVIRTAREKAHGSGMYRWLSAFPRPRR